MEITCPNCQTSLETGENHGSGFARCPDCYENIPIPSPVDTGNTIETFCSNCGAEFNATEEMMHQRIQCYRCEQKETLQHLKKCEYCAELIKFEAKLCKFCGRELSNSKIPTVNSSAQTAPINGLTVLAREGLIQEEEQYVPEEQQVRIYPDEEDEPQTINQEYSTNTFNSELQQELKKNRATGKVKTHSQFKDPNPSFVIAGWSIFFGTILLWMSINLIDGTRYYSIVLGNVLIIISIFMVNNDTKKLNLSVLQKSSLPVPRSGNIDWTWSVLLIWIINLPHYLIVRKRLGEIAYETILNDAFLSEEELKTRNTKNTKLTIIVGVIVLLIVLVVFLVGFNILK